MSNEHDTSSSPSTHPLFYVIKCKLTVVEPVGDGRDCGAASKDILVRTQNHRCHIATIAPEKRGRDKEIVLFSHTILTLCYRAIMIVVWIIIIRKKVLPSHNRTHRATLQCDMRNRYSPSPHADSCSIEIFHVVQQVPEKLNGEDEREWEGWVQIGFHVMFG